MQFTLTIEVEKLSGSDVAHLLRDVATQIDCDATCWDPGFDKGDIWQDGDAVGQWQVKE